MRNLLIDSELLIAAVRISRVVRVTGARAKIDGPGGRQTSSQHELKIFYCKCNPFPASISPALAVTRHAR